MTATPAVGAALAKALRIWGDKCNHLADEIEEASHEV
jgi:hypothetical protein